MINTQKKTEDAGWDTEDFLYHAHNSYQLTLSLLVFGIVCGFILLLSEIF